MLLFSLSQIVRVSLNITMYYQERVPHFFTLNILSHWPLEATNKQDYGDIWQTKEESPSCTIVNNLIQNEWGTSPATQQCTYIQVCRDYLKKARRLEVLHIFSFAISLSSKT